MPRFLLITSATQAPVLKEQLRLATQPATENDWHRWDIQNGYATIQPLTQGIFTPHDLHYPN